MAYKQKACVPNVELWVVIFVYVKALHSTRVKAMCILGVMKAIVVGLEGGI